MSKVLLTWELGAGLGHLVNLKPFADGLSQRGHQIFAAFRDRTSVTQIFAADSVTSVEPPFLHGRLANYITRPYTFAHILHNAGFGDLTVLGRMVDAWRRLIQQLRPALVVLDHSPLALLATRSLGLPRCLVGTGFFSPPRVTPLPTFRAATPTEAIDFAVDEQRVLSNINSVLAAYGESPLGQVSDLYAQVHHDFLATFPELDHYGCREDADYVGAWPLGVGAIPEWPAASGKRIFAYLNSNQHLPALLSGISELSTPTLIYCPGIAVEHRQAFTSRYVRFSDVPLELAAAGSQCDLAIVNGKHGTTTAMLLLGKPTVHDPHQLEQALFAQAVERLGVGVIIRPSKPKTIAPALYSALDSAPLRDAANRFAARYASYDVAAVFDRIVNQAEALLPVRMESHPARSELTVAEPTTLLHFKRFDVMAKLIYAQHRAWGMLSDWAEKIYLTHLRVFNQFVEVLPLKDSPAQFLEAFNSILDSIDQHGFLPTLSVVPVGSDGAILNGAHRLAACLVHERPITCERRPYPGFDFSAAWFRRRIARDGTALPASCADAMAVEYARRHPRCRALVIAGRDGYSDREQFRRLRTVATVAYARRIRISGSDFISLMAWGRHRGWDDVSAARLPSTVSDSEAIDLRVLVIERDESVIDVEILNELRSLNGCAGGFLTSSRLATAEAAEALLSPHAAWGLGTLRRLPMEDVLERLDDILAALNETGCPGECACVQGSGGLPALESSSKTWQITLGGRFASQLPRFRAIAPAPVVKSPEERRDDAIADMRQYWKLAGVKLLAPKLR
jgi:hypothetical protein